MLGAVFYCLSSSTVANSILDLRSPAFRIAVRFTFFGRWAVTLTPQRKLQRSIRWLKLRIPPMRRQIAQGRRELEKPCPMECLEQHPRMWEVLHLQKLRRSRLLVMKRQVCRAQMRKLRIQPTNVQLKLVMSRRQRRADFVRKFMDW